MESREMPADDVMLRKAARAFEKGRVKTALPWVLLFPVLLVVGTLGCSGEGLAVCGSCVITACCMVAAWRGGVWLRSVKGGVQLGLAASVAPMLVMPVCRVTGGAISVVGAIVCTGVGVGLGWLLARSERGSSLWVTGAIALMTAVLGCAALGLGALVGLALAAAISVPLFRARTA